jgi:hypothetical protein
VASETIAASPSAGASLWLTAAVLAAGGGLGVMASRRWTPRPAVLRLVVVALFAAFVLESSPHLVHHLLDSDRGSTCQTLQTSERSQVVAQAPSDLPPLARAPLDTPGPRSRAGGPSEPVRSGRAPTA